MEARDLDEAIDLVNATGYGLTSGLESLDDREQELWCSRIRAGNLYINRPTTGAIVLRQPFGGMGKSSVGPGIKAGGPNYVVPLMRIIGPVQNSKLPTIAFAYWAKTTSAAICLSSRLEFGSIRPTRSTKFSAAACRLALPVLSRIRRRPPAALSGSAAHAVELLDTLTDSWAGAIEIHRRSRPGHSGSYSDRSSRHASATPHPIACPARSRRCRRHLQYIADTQVSRHGRVELLWYVREQSVSHIYHRYGNLGLEPMSSATSRSNDGQRTTIRGVSGPNQSPSRMSVYTALYLLRWAIILPLGFLLQPFSTSADNIHLPNADLKAFFITGVLLDPLIETIVECSLVYFVCFTPSCECPPTGLGHSCSAPQWRWCCSTRSRRSCSSSLS